jgi:CRP-like cAMP-binding protein
VTITGRSIRNSLLAALEPSAYARIEAKLFESTLRARQVLYKPGAAIDRIYFPETAVLCMLTVMRNGDTIEAVTVGHEGASWVSASVGAPRMPCQTVVAVAGTAAWLAFDDLGDELKENHHFRDVLTKYSHALLVHSMRTAACNGLHSLRERCARWMLTTVDRVDENTFHITHEFLAMLLGASRPSLSAVIEEMVRGGIVTVRRGEISLTDRAQLLTVACECYAVIKEHYDHLRLSLAHSCEGDSRSGLR